MSKGQPVRIVRSVSDLPDPNNLKNYERESLIITLPFLLLQAYRDPQWRKNRPGRLVVTDFTSHPKLIHNRTPNQVMMVGDYGRSLAEDQLLEVAIFPEELAKFSNLIAVERNVMRDHNHYYNGVYAEDGIIVQITFRPRVYEGFLEGSLVSYELLSQKNAFNEFSLRNEAYISFLKRFKEQVSHRIQMIANSDLPIDTIIESSQNLPKRRSAHPSQEEQDQLKIKKQKQDSPPPRNVATNPLFKQVKSSDDTQKVLDSQVPESVLLSISDDDEGFIEDDFLVSTPLITPVQTILNESMGDVAGTKVQTKGCFVGIFPPLPFVMKPFGKSVRLGGFKLIFTDVKRVNQKMYSESDTLFVEFRDELSLLSFLGYDEPEEVLSNLAQIEADITDLIGDNRQRVINIVSTRFKNELYTQNYWSISDKLTDILRSR